MPRNEDKLQRVKDDPALFTLVLSVEKDDATADDSNDSDKIKATCQAWDAGQGKYVPVVDAQVDFEPETGAYIFPLQKDTNSDGEAEVDAYSDYPGTYTVSASARGGKPPINGSVNADPVSITFVSNQGDTDFFVVNVTLDEPSAEGKPYKVQVQCNLASEDPNTLGDPVNGAYVVLSGGEKSADLIFVPQSGNTGSDGHFTAEVYATVTDDYQVTATASGGNPDMPETDGSAKRQLTPVYGLQITPPGDPVPADGMTPAPVLAMLYMQPDRTPVQDGTIIFAPVDDLAINPEQGTTNANGEFTTQVATGMPNIYTLSATGSKDGIQAQAQADITFVDAPRFGLTLTSPGNVQTAANGTSATQVTAYCFTSETVKTNPSDIFNAKITFSGPEEVEIFPSEAYTNKYGECTVGVATRYAGTWTITASAEAGSGQPPLPQSVDAPPLPLRFVRAAENYFDLEVTSNGDPLADGRTPVTLTAYCYSVSSDTRQSTPLRGVQITFEPDDKTNLTFDPPTLSGTTSSNGMCELQVTTLVAGEYTISATANMGVGTDPLQATETIRFGEYVEDVEVGIEVSGGTQGAKIYANGRNQVALTVQYTVVDGDGVAAIDDVQLVTKGIHPTPITQLGWTVHDTFHEPDYQPQPYVKWMTSQAVDAASQACAPRKSPKSHDDTPSNSGSYSFYLSTNGQNAFSPQVMCVRLKYRGKWYVSTANESDDLGYDTVTLEYMDGVTYTANDMKCGGSEGPSVGDDDDNNPGQPVPDWFWRQFHYTFTLTNGNKIQDFTKPNQTLYTKKGSNCYWTELYIWDLDEKNPTVNLWSDYGASQSVSLPAGNGIKSTIIVLVRRVWGGGQSTPFPADPLTFHDEYGNPGAFYLNCDLPALYSDTHDAVVNSDTRVYNPLTSVFNGQSTSWGWPGILRNVGTVHNVQWSSFVDSWNSPYGFKEYPIGLLSQDDREHCTYHIGSATADFDSMCPSYVQIWGNYTSTKYGQFNMTITSLERDAHSSYKSFRMVTVAVSDGPTGLWLVPVWNKNAFRLAYPLDTGNIPWGYAIGMSDSSQENWWVEFNSSYGQNNEAYHFKFDSA